MKRLLESEAAASKDDFKEAHAKDEVKHLAFTTPIKERNSATRKVSEQTASTGTVHETEVKTFDGVLQTLRKRGSE